jgi:hypothetical protein
MSERACKPVQVTLFDGWKDKPSLPKGATGLALLRQINLPIEVAWRKSLAKLRPPIIYPVGGALSELGLFADPEHFCRHRPNSRNLRSFRAELIAISVSATAMVWAAKHTNSPLRFLTG